MQRTQLISVDSAFLGDDDTWRDSCQACGSLDNFGDFECAHCDVHG